MKGRLIKLGAQIDAMSLRERIMVFAAVAATVVFLVTTMWLNPMLARQKQLLSQVGQQQNNIAGIEMEIMATMDAHARDPDKDVRARLAVIKGEAERAAVALRTAQLGLVAPEKMVPLLDSILKGNGKLKLVSLKTLPASGMSGATSVAPPAGKGLDGTAAKAAGAEAKAVPADKPAELLFRHGVEIVLEGGYLDMIGYMQALEAMPTRLFWGQARLDARQYPMAQLTLTLYTLSLDPTWMTL